MGRYSKIILGPARKNDPQVTEAEAAEAIKPGCFVTMDANGRFALADDTSGRVYLAQENYLMLKGVDLDYSAYAAGPPVVRGDIVMGLEPQDDVLYAARLADGEDVTAVGTALALAGDGELAVATTGDVVIAHADEVFNNDTGESALIRIRPAGSQSSTAP